MNTHLSGYAGRILHVDLSSGKSHSEELPEIWARDFLGGFGINNRLAWDLIKPGIDPLSPANVIILGAGPLVGTMAPGAVRTLGTTKYPITGAIASGAGSMSFGYELKQAGYDNLVITGKADRPVYLRIENESVELLPADHLWGKGMHEATSQIWQEHGHDGVIAIGQAGERQVSFALAFVDQVGTIGRGGLAAVMGSKNLKAVAVKGSRGVRVSDSKRFMKAVDELFRRARSYPQLKENIDKGIMGNWDNYLKQILVGDWTPEKTTELYGPEVYKKYKWRRLACTPCFTADKDALIIRDGEDAGFCTYTHSFLTLAMTGSLFQIDKVNESMKLGHLLNNYGVCSMTFGSMANFLLEAQEKGLLPLAKLEGFPLKRNYESMLNLLQAVAFREGIGDVMADGWERILEYMGPEAAKLAILVKKNDFVFDPRQSRMGTMEFQQIVNARGPQSAAAGSPSYLPGLPIEMFKRHTERMGASQEMMARVFDSPLGFSVGRLTRCAEDWYSLFNSLGLCQRHVINRFYHVNICADLYSAATGWEQSPQEIMKSAERVWNLQKLLNVREGFSRSDDVFPDRWFEPLKVRGEERVIRDYFGQKTLTREDLEQELYAYYDERGWDNDTSVPTDKKMIELGLEGFTV